MCLRRFSGKKIDRNNQSGFTLVELLVALFVFVVAVGAAFASFSSSSQLSESARFRMVALQDARAILEEVKAVALQEVSDINLNSFKSQMLNGGGQWVDLLNNETIALTTNPDPIDGGTELATITVTVSWQEAANRTKSLSLTTQKSTF